MSSEASTAEPEAEARMREVVAFLTERAGAPPFQSAASLIFAGADTVWRLRKPVVTPAGDQRDRATRERLTRAEFALNAPHAPTLYRDVAPITRGPDGIREGGPDAETLEWVVRLEPVPTGQFLIHMAAREDGLTPPELERIGDGIVAYHARSPARPGPVTDGLRLLALQACSGAIQAGVPEDPIRRWLQAIVEQIGIWTPRLDARAEAGFVRRGHGDLHLGTLCVWRDEVVAFDAIDTEDELGVCDVGFDLASLLIDLEARAGKGAAARVLARYVGRTGDVGLLGPMPLFQSLRAMARACLLAGQGDARGALNYVGGAIAYLQPTQPVAVAVGGLPGVGKTTLAHDLAPELGHAPGALVLRADDIRKRRLGLLPETPALRDDAPGLAEAVADEFAGSTRAALADGWSVVADALFIDPAWRVPVTEAARAAGAPFVPLWLDAALPVIEERLAMRPYDASDATVASLRVVNRQCRGAGDWIYVDATDRAAALAAARAAVRRGGRAEARDGG